MFTKPFTILAINPGTRYIGIAVFHSSELLEWKMKIIQGRWSQEKIDRVNEIILELINRYKPNVLAIKHVPNFRSSKNLKLLVTKIRAIARHKKLKTHTYTIKDLRDYFCLDTRINKIQLMGYIAMEYPHLAYQYQKEQLAKNPYYFRLFEAVGLGAVCFSQLDRQKK